MKSVLAFVFCLVAMVAISGCTEVSADKPSCCECSNCTCKSCCCDKDCPCDCKDCCKDKCCK